MRAHFIYEKLTHFTEEDSDPIKDMDIGYIEVPYTKEDLKKIPASVLSDAINRIRKVRNSENKARVLVNGTDYEELGIFPKHAFLENLYDAHQYKSLLERRDKVRALNFKWGDAIKATIKGKVYMGYVNFSKRGLPITDSRARLMATADKNVMKIPIEHIEPLSPEEKKEFDKNFGYILLGMKKTELWKDLMKRKYKEDDKYHALRDEYFKLEDEIIKFRANLEKNKK